jgi:hypothetical protein
MELEDANNLLYKKIRELLIKNKENKWNIYL